jgi:hypothetical protein
VDETAHEQKTRHNGVPQSIAQRSLCTEMGIAAEWRTYESDRLIEACTSLHCASANVPSREGNHASVVDDVTVSKIVNVARQRERIRKAILDYASGGARGLFDAYESISYEIMNCGLPNYAASIGTKEWLIRQGWISEEEEDRFLKTVLYFRSPHHSTSPPALLSPPEARAFVRRILIGFIRHCIEGERGATDPQ